MKQYHIWWFQPLHLGQLFSSHREGAGLPNMLPKKRYPIQFHGFGCERRERGRISNSGLSIVLSFFSSPYSTRSSDWRIQLRGRYQELCFSSKRDHSWADRLLSDNAQQSRPAWCHIGKGEFSSVNPHRPASGFHPQTPQSIDFSMRPNGVMGFVIIKPPSPCPLFLLIYVCLRILNLYSRTSYAARRNAYLWICSPIHHQCFFPSLPTPTIESIYQSCIYCMCWHFLSRRLVVYLIPTIHTAPQLFALLVLYLAIMLGFRSSWKPVEPKVTECEIPRVWSTGFLLGHKTFSCQTIGEMERLPSHLL